MESIIRMICEKKIINTGFLVGPFCPIYGIGALIMILFLDKFKGNVLILFVTGFFILSLWEYVVGVFLEKFFKTKYWDYSDHKFNIKGRVCLTNSIFWGILGITFIRFIHPFIVKELALIDNRLVTYLTCILLIYIIVDAIISIARVKNISNVLHKIENLNLSIKEKLEEVKELSKNKEKVDLVDSIQIKIDQLKQKRNKIGRRLYRHVYRLKKAFPAINTKEITEILNKKIEIIKKERKLK